jgi:hypothetical protein
VLQISHAAVNELEVIRRRGMAEIRLVDQRHRIAAERRAPRNASSEHAGPQDENVELIARQSLRLSFQSCFLVGWAREGVRRLQCALFGN